MVLNINYGYQEICKLPENYGQDFQSFKIFTLQMGIIDLLLQHIIKT